MKKVKILLMAICFVASAGGVLAFKAMTPNGYCINFAITTEVGGPKFCPEWRTCPSFVTTVIYPTDATFGNIYCYTIAPNSNATVLANRCKTTTQLGGQLVTTTCCTEEVVFTEP